MEADQSKSFHYCFITITFLFTFKFQSAKRLVSLLLFFIDYLILLTIANSLDLDQARHLIGIELDLCFLILWCHL